MAVIHVDIKKLERSCGKSGKEIEECLTNIGMPMEKEDGETVVEVTPNRPDLFCAEGIARAVRCYYGGEAPRYRAHPSAYEMRVEGKTGKVRPAICAAVVKGVRLDEESVAELMQLQEKLHETVGRRRKKIAMGVHDLSALEGKMEYFVSRGEKFVPLDMEEEMDVKQILEKHPKGRAFAHLVGKEAVLIKDEKGVFSFPPVINGERTRVSGKTKDVLIECTGTSQETAEKAVNIMVASLAERGGKIYSVKVGGRELPNLSEEEMGLDLEEANKVLGTSLGIEEARRALSKMGIRTDGKHAYAPPYRADIISFIDIIEDIAIGHGYGNLEPSLPCVPPNRGSPDSRGEEAIDDILIGMGFLETKNYVLTNMDRLSAAGRGEHALSLKNSASEEFTHIRTSIIPSLLGCFSTNRMKGLPQLIYEIGTVYCGKEQRDLCFGVMEEGASITEIQSFLQTLMREAGKEFELVGCDDPCFINGRSADIIINKKKAGVIGAVHPEVLEKFGLEYAVVICEMDAGSLY